jgi:hypothetical protein
VTDRRTGAVVQVGSAPTGGGVRLDLSQDGQTVPVSEARPLDADWRSRRTLTAVDRVTGTRTPVDLTPDGSPSPRGSLDAVLSGDGSTVVFITDDPAVAPGLADGDAVIVRRRLADGRAEVLGTTSVSYEYVLGTSSP